MIAPTHYRSLLSPNEQDAYRIIVTNLLEHNDSFPIPHTGINQASMRRTVYAVSCDHPELFWVNYRAYRMRKRRHGYDLQFEMLLNRSASDSLSHILHGMQNTLRAQLDKRESSHHYKYIQIARAISNAAAYLDSDIEPWDHAFDPLLRHITIFEGATKLFLYFCQRFDLPCAMVRGTVNGERHTWNVVELDGKKMFIDVSSIIDRPKHVFQKLQFFRSREYLIRHGYKWNEITLWGNRRCEYQNNAQSVGVHHGITSAITVPVTQ